MGEKGVVDLENMGEKGVIWDYPPDANLQQPELQPQNKAFSLKKMVPGSLKMTSEAAGTRSVIFSIKGYPCMPRAGRHSIQGMAGHFGQTRKQNPLCFISKTIINCAHALLTRSLWIHMHTNTHTQKFLFALLLQPKVCICAIMHHS